jgi:hypothetical protein
MPELDSVIKYESKSKMQDGCGDQISFPFLGTRSLKFHPGDEDERWYERGTLSSATHFA